MLDEEAADPLIRRAVEAGAQFATYVSFPTGTLGHPTSTSTCGWSGWRDWNDPVARFPRFGGQGTMNVNGWSPDSRRFAFMAYSIDAAEPTR